MNELIAYNRTNVYKGSKLKKDSQMIVMYEINHKLHGIHIENPVIMHYHFWEPNSKRDIDNVASFAMKVIQDALVKCRVLDNDGWKNIRGFKCEFDVDQQHPRIDVVIEEME